MPSIVFGRVPGRLRRLACHESRDEPERSTWPDVHARVQATGHRLKARALDEQASDAFHEGEESGATADKYIRLTVVLASILFLVGISTQFPLRGVRYGLIALGTVLLVVSLAQVATLPKPPG